MDEIEVLGEIQRNRHVSTSLETWNGQNTANVTLIADGSGKFEVNGIPLHKFFTVNFCNFSYLCLIFLFERFAGKTCRNVGKFLSRKLTAQKIIVVVVAITGSIPTPVYAGGSGKKASFVNA